MTAGIQEYSPSRYASYSLRVKCGILPWSSLHNRRQPGVTSACDETTQSASSANAHFMDASLAMA
jgi:hypothetical protein